jgi:hypothetical protein
MLSGVKMEVLVDNLHAWLEGVNHDCLEEEAFPVKEIQEEPKRDEDVLSDEEMSMGDDYVVEAQSVFSLDV